VPTSSKKQNKSTQKHNATIASRTIPTIPPCICGSERIFEFQLLPSILHVLDVDSSVIPHEVDESVDINSVGGMNWGSIAVYSCPNSCDESREEVCVVQCGDVAIRKKNDGDDGGNGEEEEVD
jgi:pre-rRNA-processing protein TSR4